MGRSMKISNICLNGGDICVAYTQSNCMYTKQLELFSLISRALFVALILKGQKCVSTASIAM